jgi:hypothetical protein
MEVHVDYEVRVTNVSGSIVFGTGATDRRLTLGVINNGAFKSNASKTSTLTGLTAGTTYFVRTMHYASASSATSTLNMRRLDVIPL